MKKFLTILLITFFALSLSAEIDGPRVGVSTNVDKDPEALKGIGVDENFGAHLNLDLIVTNEAGEKVALRTYFEQGRPVVINMVYYSCGGTCNALLTGSFMDYAIPRASDLPNFNFYYNEILCETNLMGVKGAGEAGAIGAPPAVINAICNALDIENINMPAKPEKIWRILKSKINLAAE